MISLLNSYAGLVRCGDGICAEQQASDHCRRARWLVRIDPLRHHVKAMNRSFTNVLFGAFGQVQAAAAASRKQSRCAVRRAEEAAAILAAANKVVIVPGYGMAVAQAQHKVRELYDTLTKTRRGSEVRDSSGRGPHARPHERPAGRGRHPLRPADRDGRHQRRLPADRRGAGDRRQRRHQSRCAHRSSPARFTACRFSTWTRRAP